MGLFKRENKNKIEFIKDKVIKDIIIDAPVYAPDWTIFVCPASFLNKLNPDFLAIKSVNIQREINITKNPFSHYRKTIPSIYQIVIGIYVAQDEENVIQSENWRNIIVDSSDLLFRKLDMEE